MPLSCFCKGLINEGSPTDISTEIVWYGVMSCKKDHSDQILFIKGVNVGKGKQRWIFKDFIYFLDLEPSLASFESNIYNFCSVTLPLNKRLKRERERERERVKGGEGGRERGKP